MAFLCATNIATVILVLYYKRPEYDIKDPTTWKEDWEKLVSSENYFFYPSLGTFLLFWFLTQFWLCNVPIYHRFPINYFCFLVMTVSFNALLVVLGMWYDPWLFLTPSVNCFLLCIVMAPVA